MDNFWLGVNYWASHAGTDMWAKWDEDIVRRDLAALARAGAVSLRVFPLWRDFQPVTALYGQGHSLREYRMAGDTLPDNPWFLDGEMLRRFHVFCSIAEENGLSLIVGLITGWMSGRLYMPAALQGKNLFTDPEALYMQQLFICGFVSLMKEEKSIVAWDLGNECNCMDRAGSRGTAANWTAMCTCAIRAQDAARPVISGMHSLTLAGEWRVQDQGLWCDMLTTHPYPYWVEHANFAAQDDYRTLLHAALQTQFYADVSGKPCLVEEIGTMGPMVCNEETAAGFLRVNLWSAWAHGSPGLLWWCAFDQDQLGQPPYDWNMVERELGLLHRPGQPKRMAGELAAFRRALETLSISLPPARRDGVCLLTWEQDHPGIAYMTGLLATQAGLNLRYAFCDQPLPESKLYLLPSVRGGVMAKTAYEKLKQAVYNGAVLYISLQDGILTEFEELTGFRPIRSRRYGDAGTADFQGHTITYARQNGLDLAPTAGEVLLRDEKGQPLLGRNRYGKGTVWLLNMPLEENLLTDPMGFHGNNHLLYAAFAGNAVKANPYVGVTVHGEIAVLINYSSLPQAPGLTLKTADALYGDPALLPPFGAAVARLATEK